MQPKEMLVPVLVPWKISPSVPYLRLHSSDEGKPVAATFIGFFKCEVASETAGLVVVNDPGVFVRADTASSAKYRLVQVLFKEGLHAKQRPAVSDYEVIPEDDYDWSLVPSGIHGEETAEESVARVHNLWFTSGNCPDPSMYEVRGSKWLTALGLDTADWRHYVLLGHDDYIEVVARGWQWQPGQVVA